MTILQKHDIIILVITLKIKEIRKFEIEVKKDEDIIYNGISDNASSEIKNMDIKNINMENKVIKIEVES